MHTKMQATRILVIITIIGLSTSACTATFPTEPSFAAQVTGLVIHYPNIGTKAVAGFSDGGSRQYEAYTIDSDGVWADVTSQATWTSSDIVALATTTRGVVTYRSAGHYEIYALYQGMQATLAIDVRAIPPFPYLELSSLPGLSPSVRILTGNGAGGSQSLPSTQVTWSSTDDRIATVDSRGALTRIAPGNVRITATRDGLSDFYWRSFPPRD